MGIRFHCETCNTLLNVKNHQGGQEGMCPTCLSEIQVPEKSTVSSRKRKKSKRRNRKTADEFSIHDDERSTAVQSESDSFLLDKPRNPGIDPEEDPIADAPRKVWYIRHAKHSEKGPIKGKDLREMLDDGKVRPGSIVSREDWVDWLPVAEVFPEVPTVQKPPAATRSVFNDPNYEIPGSMNPEVRKAERQRKKLVRGIVAIVAGLVTIVGLTALLLFLL